MRILMLLVSYIVMAVGVAMICAAFRDFATNGVVPVPVGPGLWVILGGQAVFWWAAVPLMGRG